MSDRTHVPFEVKPSFLLLFFAILIVIISATDAQISFNRMIAMTDARAKARSSRLDLEHVLSLFKDLETGSRGFVMTGLEEYLEPYAMAKEQLPSAYSHLKNQFKSDQLPAGFTWNELDGLVEHRFEISQRMVEKRLELGAGVFQEVALFNEGKKTMDKIRGKFSQLDLFQDSRINNLNDSVHKLRTQAETFSWIAAGITALMVGLALFLLVHERKARTKLEWELLESNQRLEVKVSERTKDLSEAKARISEFALVQENAIEEERRRLAREVHDQIGQIFTAIKLIIGSVQENALPEGQYKVLQSALESGISSTRKITAELRPPLLDDLGLEAALDSYIGQFASSAGYQYEVEIKDVDKLTETQALTIFRITQEAISNIIKYARAANVVINGLAVDGFYEFKISDDGDGFEFDSRRPGALGLIAMQERANLLNGDCKIESRLTQGTTVTIHLPLATDV